MHISEGILSAPVLLGGAALATLGIAIGLRKLDEKSVMTAALLSSAFFVGSLVHIPIGPSSVHLILNGFLGLLLGWAAFPAIFIALLLQAVLLNFGGLSILGVNTFNMAFPAVLGSFVFSFTLFKTPLIRSVGAFCCGAFGVAGAGFLTAFSLGFSDEGFLHTAQILFVAHLPVMLIEGVITALVVAFIAKVRPEIFYFFRR